MFTRVHPTNILHSMCTKAKYLIDIKGNFQVKTCEINKIWLKHRKSQQVHRSDFGLVSKCWNIVASLKAFQDIFCQMKSD